MLNGPIADFMSDRKAIHRVQVTCALSGVRIGRIKKDTGQSLLGGRRWTADPLPISAANPHTAQAVREHAHIFDQMRPFRRPRGEVACDGCPFRRPRGEVACDGTNRSRSKCIGPRSTSLRFCSRSSQGRFSSVPEILPADTATDAERAGLPRSLENRPAWLLPSDSFALPARNSPPCNLCR